MDEGPAAASGTPGTPGTSDTSGTELVEDLFRKEYAHLVSALTRVLGPANLPLAEDAVHDALVSAMQAWRFGLPRDPKAWLVRVAHNRAVDVIRREQRLRTLLPELATTTELTATVEAALAPAAESAGQLAMMFAVCDPGLSRETHVTLILRWLCGLSPREIGQAFLVDTQTIDRRLHRGRGRLRQLGRLPDVDDVHDLPDVEALEDQDRTRWDRVRIERGLTHLARSAAGDHLSRWHLEAGIACEHAIAPSVRETGWDRVAGLYDVLARQSWSPVVALNRGLAVAERDGVDAGRRELAALAGEPKLSRYPFYWAARADLERRAGRPAEAREY
ncbi:RNA polymerase sigma factor [Actinacidiphila bryophytorum]|uniref:RNA polymerase sigma factor n=1 Tax=Actinacidiphila bryophytorum TaxID=1436133 RepID=UPI002176A27E|nr:sigma-70 family RNA polymerase sigma factor [Actinacidiphila bryophytorum]UWE10357.1 sigma-70 family RNA polymerase sigma factor [Actinacidiphila bryophytorum]